MIYPLEEISQRISPVAEKYQFPAVYLYGSYARGTATDSSNIDLIVDTKGTSIQGIEAVDTMYHDLEEALQKKITVVTVQSLEQEPVMASDVPYRENILKDKIQIYPSIDR